MRSSASLKATEKRAGSDITTPVLCICLIAESVEPQGQVVSTSRFKAAPGPVLLSNASSSEVVNLTGVQTRLECLAQCQLKGCLLASHASSSRLCQLVLVNDASRGLGPAGTHVQRLLGSEAGARLWTVGGFKDILALKMRSVSFQISNSNTGRNGSIQSVTIPSTGCYRIEVSGAKGGSNSFSGFAGGNGAVMSGSFDLPAGTQLTVVVGQAGGPPKNRFSGGGGGGGSFVYRTGDEFLLAAAGGGGAGTYYESGRPGNSGLNGTDTHPDPISYGGINGLPGFNNPSAMPSSHNHGGCGAGWLGRPVNPRRGSDDGDRGGSRAEDWVGGAAGGDNTGIGGFGGGGGGGNFGSVYGAAGAGGGYSGGGTGYVTSFAGGGGGSICSGYGCSGVTGGNAGQHGGATFQLLMPLGDSFE